MITCDFFETRMNLSEIDYISPDVPINPCKLYGPI